MCCSAVRWRPAPRVSDNAAATYGLHSLTVESELPLDAPLAEGPPDYRFRLSTTREADGAPTGTLLGELHFGGNPRVISSRDPDSLRAYFDNANRLASEVPIYRAIVPWGPPFAPGLAAEILAAVGLAEPASSGRQ